jgi:hypothetical protein
MLPPTEKADADNRSRRYSFFTEAWHDSRAQNKKIVADAIRGTIAALASTVTGYAIRFAPGMTPKRLSVFETYHLYFLLTVWALFNLFLFLELCVLALKQLKKVITSDVEPH